MCHDPFKYPELKWKKTAAGKNIATITIAGSSYTNKYGSYTTRTLNGMIPGPLMRMEVSILHHNTSTTTAMLLMLMLLLLQMLLLMLLCC
jgi:hypothetical protein